jgi:rhodanese-related sulfurtransferase
MYKILSVCLLLGLNLNADIGCASSVMETKESCSENTIFQKSSSILENVEKSNTTGIVRITEDLESVKIIYQKKEFLIERITNKEQSCPPNCIQAMSIGDIKTVGELETLDFINSLQHIKNRILVDTRSVREYKKSTIPGAVNIPSVLLDFNNKYRDDILGLLGGKKLQKKWYFRNIQKLLLFDNGILDNQATKAIKSLIDVGYPQNKILYYRGGFNSWKSLGLTLL